MYVCCVCCVSSGTGLCDELITRPEESYRLRCVVVRDLRGPFLKFCTLYVFSLKMNLFYKIHLQAFNVISIVLYHSGPAFRKVLYSCLDAIVLIRRINNDGVQTGI
jgi:hypothetical protein